MRTQCRFAAFAALVALAIPAAELGALEPDRRRIRTRAGADTTAVLLALNGAQRKLRDPECRQLLADFRDGEERPLGENLAALRMEPEDYVTLLVVLDGGRRDGGRLCRSASVAAVTSPLSRVVYVCGTSFRAQTAGLRENTLIHEMLHSLGLGENPPTADEINRQVRRRCGM
jgi:hypothetical protein